MNLLAKEIGRLEEGASILKKRTEESKAKIEELKAEIEGLKDENFDLRDTNFNLGAFLEERGEDSPTERYAAVMKAIGYFCYDCPEKGSLSCYTCFLNPYKNRRCTS